MGLAPTLLTSQDDGLARARPVASLSCPNEVAMSLSTSSPFASSPGRAPVQRVVEVRALG